MAGLGGRDNSKKKKGKANTLATRGDSGKKKKPKKGKA